MPSRDIAHGVSALVTVSAREAFAFLCDPQALSRWSLGCMDLTACGNGVYTGHSLFDGAQGWLHIDADPVRYAVDYHVGTLTERQPRISARVVPGPVVGYAEHQCIVTMTAWRSVAMSDERWQRLCATHETEIWLIKAQVEQWVRRRPLPEPSAAS